LGTYRRLFEHLIREFKSGISGSMDRLVDFIEKTGMDALEYLESLDLDTLESLMNNSSFEELYNDFFGGKGESFTYSRDDEWFKEKERKFREERERRKRGRGGRTSHRRKSGGFDRNFSSSQSNSRWHSDDPFVILGVSRGDKWSKIRVTYARLVKEYHPDTRKSGLSDRENSIYDSRLQKIYVAWKYFVEHKSEFL